MYALACLTITVVAGSGCRHRVPGPPPPEPPALPRAPPPAPPPVAAPPSARPDDEYGRIRGADLDTIDRMGLLIDVHFAFNRADIRDVDRSILTRDAEILRQFDFRRVTVEGHCDERGTVEYNLALGERRAAATRDYLVSLGIAADRRTASYGKEAPACYEHGEDCRARNRRAHLTGSGKNPRQGRQ